MLHTYLDQKLCASRRGTVYGMRMCGFSKVTDGAFGVRELFFISGRRLNLSSHTKGLRRQTDEVRD